MVHKGPTAISDGWKSSERLLLRNSLVCRWFIEILAGERSYRSLAREVLKKGLILPFHTGLSRRRVVRLSLGGRSAG